MNARSIVNKIDEFQAIIHDLQPDIVGITETWANDSILDAELTIQGYHLFRCDRGTGNRGGGVLLYVNSSLRPVEFVTKSYYGEHTWCCIGDLIIGVCYRSTNAAIVGQGNNSNLINVLSEVANKHVLIMGDFNYPDIDWFTCMPCSSDPDTVDFVRTIEDCFYIQHVLSPTRGDAVLNLVLSTDSDLVSNVNVIDQLGNSDRNMITFTIHFACEVYVSNRKIKDYIRGDYESMRTVLADINWDNFMSAPVNDCWDNFKV